MKNKIIFLLLLYPLISHGQNSNKIKFINGISWEKVQQKAKSESKLIFVDAYATWCGPCKAMDKMIYTDSNVAKYANSKFVSIKLQMDSTTEDSPTIKESYKDAFGIKNRYKISVLPAFLFFSSEGKVIERDFGYLEKDEFLMLLQKAADPKANYAGRLIDFKSKILPKDQWIPLAISAKKNKDDSLALLIAKSYKKEFIDNTKPYDAITIQFSDYISQFSSLLSYKDPIIQYMYHYTEKSDSLMNNNNISKSFVSFLITRDLITPRVWRKGSQTIHKPNWSKIQKDIASKFDLDLARRLILDSKINWYNQEKNWPMVVKYEIERLDYNQLDTTGMGTLGINNLVYQVIFRYSNDPIALRKGIDYMEFILKIDPTNHSKIDTYSNILYKAGFKEKAIEQEEKALIIAQKEKDKRSIELYKNTLEKMKQSKPTWN